MRSLDLERGKGDLRVSRARFGWGLGRFDRLNSPRGSVLFLDCGETVAKASLGASSSKIPVSQLLYLRQTGSLSVICII